MSADELREAARKMRDDFSAIDIRGDARWLAVADWLDDIATRHSKGEPTELVLHYDEECSVCEDGGHEVPVCNGCFPTWEGMDGYCVWPCVEVKSALTLARAYLNH